MAGLGYRRRLVKFPENELNFLVALVTYLEQKPSLSAQIAFKVLETADLHHVVASLNIKE
jgi:hypothetical protein